MNIDEANYLLGKAIAGFQDDEIEDLANVFEDMDPDAEWIDEASGGKVLMQCLDCGARFKKKLGPKTTEVKCPKCGSYDTDLA